MTADIENKEYWDVRDLAAKAHEYSIEFSNWANYSNDDRKDAMDTLNALAEAVNELNYSGDVEAGDFKIDAAEYDEQWQVRYAEAIADAWEKAGDYDVTLIADYYFEDAMKELVSDLGYLPAKLPGFIESNIDWKGVADDLKVDYTSITLNGNEYLTRVG